MKITLGSEVLAEDDRSSARMSHAYFCLTCGELWGRVHRGQGWYVVSRPCAEHGGLGQVGGSFFQDYEWAEGREADLLRAHPGLRAHELKVHLAWAERNLPTQQAAAQT